LVVAAVLSFVVFNRILRVNFFVATLRFSHWLAIIGTIGIAVAIPLFTIAKRRSHPNWTRITRFHIFGNLIFFTLILFHFSTQMARPLSNFPEIGTGLAMFIALGAEIVSGFAQRFRSQRPIYKKIVNPVSIRFLHASLVMVFYLVIVFHVLNGLGIL
jgi:hypothetical protein